MDLVDDVANHLHRQGVGGGAMVWLALAAGGLPQGAENRLSDGTAQSAKHRGPMETACAADSHCLAFVGDSAHGAAGRRYPSDQRGFAERHPGYRLFGSTPPQYHYCPRSVARHCTPGGLPRPQKRWPTWMADVMERMDAGHGRLGGRSSRRSSPSFMICV